MEWNGNGNKSKPLAFVGKECVLTLRISLKPAKFMEDMTMIWLAQLKLLVCENASLEKAKLMLWVL